MLISWLHDNDSNLMTMGLNLPYKKKREQNPLILNWTLFFSSTSPQADNRNKEGEWKPCIKTKEKLHPEQLAEEAVNSSSTVLVLITIQPNATLCATKREQILSISHSAS